MIGAASVAAASLRWRAIDQSSTVQFPFPFPFQSRLINSTAYLHHAHAGDILERGECVHACKGQNRCVPLFRACARRRPFSLVLRPPRPSRLAIRRGREVSILGRSQSGGGRAVGLSVCLCAFGILRTAGRALFYSPLHCSAAPPSPTLAVANERSID